MTSREKHTPSNGRATLNADMENRAFSRRHFLQTMAASTALIGAAACTKQPVEKIVPFINQPENMVPGKPLYFATALTRSGYARGAIAKSYMGRPIKIEGNPKHPDSLGATDVFMQASVMSLYDPARLTGVSNEGHITSWSTFERWMIEEATTLRGNQGQGLHFLTGAMTSPTFQYQMNALRQRYPRAQWHVYEPTYGGGARSGAQRAFGQDLQPIYQIDRASRILTLDAHLFNDEPGNIRYSHDYIAGRRIRKDNASMNRMYALESMPTFTGASADHLWSMNPLQIQDSAIHLARALGVSGIDGIAAVTPAQALPWLPLVAKDLQAGGASTLIAAGDHQPPIVHALAYRMNEILGSIGTTIRFIDPVAAGQPEALADLHNLVQAMDAGDVSMLVIIGVNPVYSAPIDLDFAGRLDRVRRRIYINHYPDETSRHCHWVLPMQHELETWGDARAFDGTISIIQPLIAPLRASVSPVQLLDLMNGNVGRSAYDIVREYWQGLHLEDDFEPAWRTYLQDGIVQGTAFSAITPKTTSTLAATMPATSPDAPVQKAELYLVLRPDQSVWDGQYAPNAWLQECPRPLTKLTWDNAAIVSPRFAKQMKLDTGQMVRLTATNRSLEAPVWIMAGHPDDCVTLHLGQGHRHMGQTADGVGVNAYRLRTSTGYWQSPVQLEPLRERHMLVSTQTHRRQEKRNIANVMTLAQFAENPEVDFRHYQDTQHPPPSLYPEYDYNGYRWGMTVDLTACIGCNACVLACQTENNIPVVGKQQVAMGREMHWLRIDQYDRGEDGDTAEGGRATHTNPQAIFQPMLCVHCEKAPCEVVCPVVATMHDSEGLNVMVYNRCVGTRYCSNNCPYKVRRFNYLRYTQSKDALLNLAYNPDVTVRSRGVMEKCSYCLQRISAARIHARIENRAIRADEFTTACAQACPTKAIIFGDLNNPRSEAAKLKAEPHDYSLLGELNTQPRTTYLARVENLNPELEGTQA